ncbi:MAG: glycosyltransferase family 2 protein [bacterium]
MNCETLIIIPARNEQGNIAEVIADLKKVGFGDILVVDDGSDDNTGIAASKAGAKVITHSVNMGVGAGSRSGFEFAADRNYEYVVTFDGDGQMRAEDAARIYEEAQKGYDFVYGSRHFDFAGVPKVRKYTNFLADVLTASLSGKFVRDTQSGLRCIKVDLLKKFNLKARGYAISSELVVASLINGVTPKPVKIDAIYTKESLKKGQKISNSLRVVRELLV